MAEKEYIEREAAIAEVAMMAEDRRIPVDSYGGEVVGEVIRLLRGTPAADVVERASGIIGVIPAADVRPVVTARWLDDWETGCSECSACHDSFLWEDFNGVADWNFCPNCGARMEES